MRSPRDLPRLTSLRAFAALAVFGCHLEQWAVWVPPGRPFHLGWSGVPFFFVLSGFVLTWGYRRGDDSRSFWRRRFARIWPSHAVTWLIVWIVPVTAVEATPTGSVLNLLLLQSWIPGGDQPYAMNGVAWTLSCEAGFYAVFPLAVRVLTSLRPDRRWWVLAGCFAGQLTVALLLAEHAQVLEHQPLYRLAEFVVGIVLALQFRAGRVPPVPMWCALMLAGGSVLLLGRQPNELLTCVGFTATAALLITAAAQLDVSDRPGILVSRPLGYAGKVSFTFYLVHELVMLNVGELWLEAGVLAAAEILVASAVLAVALHHGVERPGQRWLRNRGGRNRGGRDRGGRNRGGRDRGGRDRGGRRGSGPAAPAGAGSWMPWMRGCGSGPGS